MKKTVIISFFVLAVVFFVISFRVEKKETVQTTIVPSAEVAKVGALLAKDTDGDGLKDWEEELWKTDAHTADTDGDGTNDSDEITAGRNPLVKAPDDSLDAEAIKTKINQPRPEDETPTARFSREFFGRYLELKRRNGGKIPPEALATLIEDAIADAPRIAESKSYIAVDLSLVSSSKQTLHTYGNDLGTAIAEHSSEGMEDVLAILGRSLEEGQEEELARLAVPIDAYKGFIERLLVIPVPASAVPAHRVILTASDGVQKGLMGVKNLYSDPLNVLPSLTLFQESAQKLADGFKLLQALFIREGIKFTPEESGYLIMELGV